MVFLHQREAEHGNAFLRWIMNLNKSPGMNLVSLAEKLKVPKRLEDEEGRIRGYNKMADLYSLRVAVRIARA